MKKKFKLFVIVLLAFLLGLVVANLPDLIDVYSDFVISKYQKSECVDKGKGPDQCSFFDYYDKYKVDHKTLEKITGYFQLGQGPAYWVLSGRCSNKIFHNPSAAPKDSGKITMRQYFWSRCSDAMKDASDLIFRDADKAAKKAMGNESF